MADLDGALARRFEAVQRQLLTLVKTQRKQQESYEDILRSLRDQQADLVRAMTKLVKQGKSPDLDAFSHSLIKRKGLRVRTFGSNY